MNKYRWVTVSMHFSKKAARLVSSGYRRDGIPARTVRTSKTSWVTKVKKI